MEFVDQVKSSVDIVRVIGEYMRLRRASPQRYQGLCPFHTEKTPSFSVYVDKQRYKCFGCGESGDVIKFIQEIQGLTFWESLKLLAEQNGIPIPRRSDLSDPEAKLRAALYRMHEIAGQVFQAALYSPAGSIARDYLGRRELTQGQADEFALGYADPGGSVLARRFENEGFTAEQMDKSGLVRRREDGSFYDAFRGRLMFTIHNELGKIVAFAGRALKEGDEPKYINSQGTPIYEKRRLLYNLHRARKPIQKHERAVLVEGYMDVIGVYSAGVQEVVASCGTALTDGHVQALRRHAPALVLNLDPDAAGAGATERLIESLLRGNLKLRIIELEDGLDPDEYVKAHGAPEYQKKVDTAMEYYSWLTARVRRTYGNSAEERMRGFKDVLYPKLKLVPDRLERAAIAHEAAAYLGLDAGLVLQEVRKAPVEKAEAASPATASPLLPANERILLNAILTSPEAALSVVPHLRERGLEGLMGRAIFEAVLAAASDRAPALDEVEARLDERDRAVLHRVVFADQIADGMTDVERAQACLAAIGDLDTEGRRTEIRRKIREAERSGDFAEALRWTRELERIGS
jgi:DNA primase